MWHGKPAVAKFIRYSPVDLWVQSDTENQNNWLPCKSDAAQNMVAHEFHGQMSIDNENILTIYDHFRQQINGENELVVVMEKADMALHELRPFSMSTRLSILIEVTNGLTAQGFNFSQILIIRQFLFFQRRRKFCHICKATKI